jgi:hypothetical protein
MFSDRRWETKDPELNRTNHPTKYTRNFNLVRNSQNDSSSLIILIHFITVFTFHDAESKESMRLWGTQILTCFGVDPDAQESFCLPPWRELKNRSNFESVSSEIWQGHGISQPRRMVMWRKTELAIPLFYLIGRHRYQCSHVGNHWPLSEHSKYTSNKKLWDAKL